MRTGTHRFVSGFQRGHRLLSRDGRKRVEELVEAVVPFEVVDQVAERNPSWSPDGRFILYKNSDPKTGNDIWALPLDGNRTGTPFPVVQTDSDERDAQFSPDGKWIAFGSNESGRYEIYAQQFPRSAGPPRISTTGGAQVRWRSDRKELFYIALDNRLMAVPIQFARDSQSVEAGPPVPLFATHVGGSVQVFRQQYVVSSDGQRFLMNTVTEDASTSPITVILNWKAKPQVP